jgi:hypothetical protein
MSRTVLETLRAQGRDNSLVGLTEALRRDPPSRDLVIAALQTALALELSTLPPYLTAYWSVKEPTSEAGMELDRIWHDEMWHLATVANMIAGLGGRPQLVSQNPRFPGPPPGGVHADLCVPLQGLTKRQLRTFMEIERPAFDPVAKERALREDSIGEFYAALIQSIKTANPPLEFDFKRQLAKQGKHGGAAVARSPDDAIALLTQIVQEGEGSTKSPTGTPTEGHAHYYAFGEILYGRRLKEVSAGTWRYEGTDLPWPDVWPVAQVPCGGYSYDSRPDEAGAALKAFDGAWTKLLRKLEETWANSTPDETAYRMAFSAMIDIKKYALQLVKLLRPDGVTTYAPCFRIVP